MKARILISVLLLNIACTQAYASTPRFRMVMS